MKDWFNKKMAMIAIGLASVEKDALTQMGGALTEGISQNNALHQGKLMNSLKKGEVTQEVENLRWRMYKVLKAANETESKRTGALDADGIPITRTKKKSMAFLKKISVDSFDSYDVEMVVDNNEIQDMLFETLNALGMDEDKKMEVSYIEDQIKSKSEKPIGIGREYVTRFPIEKHATKMVVRRINEKERLLEFYVSMYPAESNTTSKLFLNALKKAIENPIQAEMLGLNEVFFTTYDTMGKEDFLEFKYNNTKFDKIVEYNGNYVIKFIADVEVDGVDITEKYKVEELDELYRIKAKKE